MSGEGAPQAEGERETLLAQADRLDARHHAEQTFMARIGRAIQPVFEPLGFDRQLTVGILASFAAREVFVSTMSVIVLGDEDLDIEDQSVIERVRSATRDDGTPVFTTSVSLALFVYYILAMQCLPTMAVTAKEAGGVRWAFVQFAWMSGLAYVLGVIVLHVARALGAT